MRAIDQVKLLEMSIDQLNRSCERLDSKFYDMQKIMRTVLEDCNKSFAVLIEKVEVLTDLPIMDVSGDGAPRALELDEFMNVIVSIYPDFQDALLMLYEALLDVVVADDT